MSSRNKRSAESVEVSRKKKPRKDNDDDAFDEDDSASSFNDDDLEELDPKNVITTGRRTRGIRVDYTKVANTEGLDDDSESETETKGPKKRKEAVKNPRTKSPERKQGTNVQEEVDEGDEGDEGGEDGGEEEGQDDDLGDENSEDGDDDDDD